MDEKSTQSLFTHGGRKIRGLPPIVGDEGGSSFLARDAYIQGNTMGDFGSGMEDGVSFLLDIQSASFDEQILLGSGVTDRTAIRLRLHADGIPDRVEMMLRDDDGKVLAGYVDTSISRAKRLVCTADPRSNLLSFFELQPWVNSNLQTCYTKQDGPIRFSNLTHPLIMGGWNVDSQRQGYYIGRIAEVAIFNRWYSKNAIKPFKKASTNPTNLPLIGQVSPPDVEQLTRLRADISRLQRFSQKAAMEYDDLFDASVILYRWFLDKRPMIQEFCQAYGIQLWFYGKNEMEGKYDSVVLKDAPTYYQKPPFGSHGLFGFKWITLEAFLKEEAFFVDTKPISHAHFVDLVRNKLGGGHFDKDRSAIQRRLKEFTDQFRLVNQNALYYQMHQLVQSIMEALQACGVIDAITIGLS